jgi:trimeric autotransporter adhesin
LRVQHGKKITAGRPGSRRRRTSASLAVGLLVLGGLGVAPASAQAADGTGRSAEHAAVSCWDIKQRDAGAPDGTYWLLTPALKAPQRFYCDMTTDGGGWVLIGRGREGWDFSYNGRGSADEVHQVVDGPGAFSTRTLPAKTVDGLLHGTRVDQLADGIRLRRATTADGATRQEVRFSFSQRDRFVWTFGAEHPLRSFRFGATTGGSAQSANFGTNQTTNRVITTEFASHGYTSGWALGSSLTGTNGSTTYLWSANNGGANPLPFTQVFVRPRLRAADVAFPAIPDGGLPADAQRPLLSNLSQPSEWGVTGRANGSTGELDTEAQAFAQSGNRMLVGGNFRFVQRGPNATGTNRVEQRYLAAFDVGTGAFLPDFRPTFNGQVKDLHTLANGTVVAAGEFTTVNGAPAAGIVALDPVTGATDGRFRVHVENRLSGGVLAVTAMDAHGPWLYLGGRFTHLSGGTRTSAVYARMGARVSITDGTPDPNWNPLLNGTVLDVDASPLGDRAYFAGYFSQSGQSTAQNVAILSTEPGAAVVPGLGQPSFSHPVKYQQAVREVGDRVWHGGSEHMLFSYRRSDFARLSGNITRRGGDFQVIHDQSGVVYGGCHCGNWNYSDSYRWDYDFLIPGWSQADNIRFVGAWDARTGQYLPEFVPGLNATYGQGPWGMTTDSNGTMWIGGDFSQSQTTGGRWQWVGGFVRYAERDSAAPTRPGPVSGSHAGTTTTLRWGASTDDRGPVTYEVLRGDRVIATTANREITVTSPSGTARYFVRAVDGSGNRSATTTVHAVTGPSTK